MYNDEMFVHGLGILEYTLRSPAIPMLAVTGSLWIGWSGSGT